MNYATDKQWFRALFFEGLMITLYISFWAIGYIIVSPVSFHLEEHPSPPTLQGKLMPKLEY